MKFVDQSHKNVFTRFLLPSTLCVLVSIIDPLQAVEKSNIVTTDLFVQSSDRFVSKDNLRPLNLTAAIEQGLRLNNEQQVRNYQDEVLDVQWAGAKSAFWFPEIKLVLSSEEQRISRLRSGNKRNNPTPSSAQGTLALSMGEYTVFNWGKDYLQYSNKRDSYSINKQNLIQKKRVLRHQLIINYFELMLAQSLENINKEYLRHGSYIYRLSTEKLQQGKLTRQEYHQARAVYLDSQQAYHLAQLNTQAMNEKMAYLLNDPVGTRYHLAEKINYKEFKLPFEQAQSIAQENAYPILSAIIQKNIAERDYEVARKENLPLPKFTIDLGAYTKRFGPNEAGTRYETRPNDSSLEIVATVNASWDLLGDDGFLNSRKLERSYLYKAIGEQQIELSRRENGADLRQQYLKITNYQKQVMILEAKANNLLKTFDVTLDNFLNKRTPFINFSQSLEQMIRAESELEQFKFYHLREKVNLATMAGVDDFPGEQFEKLATTKKD